MLKVKMVPGLKQFERGEGGIKQVVQHYYKYLPQFDIKLVEDGSYDLLAAHAGVTEKDCDICHCHGLYWTADYDASSWEYEANARIVESIRSAKVTTVPSDWVAQTLRRDMRINPVVIPHGIESNLWENKGNGKYVLWNKNRPTDVCTTKYLDHLANVFSNINFLTTFSGINKENIKIIGTVPHNTMKGYIENCGLYLATTKETFGIGTLEAMASGKPILGFAWGGNLDLVKHGVNGYLAYPGSLEDLERGFEYCLRNHETLGKNSLELAKLWTWEKACEIVAVTYQNAAISHDNDVTVVIPCYNKEQWLEGAVLSVLQQSYAVKQIIIIDDGSTDKSGEIGNKLASQYDKVTYHYQSNAGVANARNAGISLANTEYVCCLDADDRIAEKFIEACVTALEKDHGLSLAYTGLMTVYPDGKSQPSQWPGRMDFDRQLKKQNQVPTCNVFRKSMWIRTGGYRQRYAPEGAGSEDAEFWTRCGLAGFKIEKVTDSPLFLYSINVGITSRKNYSEVYWLNEHPAAHDNIQPFASLAKPKKNSHPVHQYDMPLVSVVIPVGPGHKESVKRAIESVESQTFRDWEIVVVWDCEPGELTAYPFVKQVYTSGKMGAGYARNRGAEKSAGGFLVFLDADDWLATNALEKMVEYWKLNDESIIYSDYVFKVTLDKAEREKLGNLVVEYKEDALSTVKHKWIEYDCEKFKSSIAAKKLYHWCLVTCMVPTAWHKAIGGFDESMKSWEDVDYYWRLAWKGYCFTRVPEPLVMYNFETGTRRKLACADNEASLEIANDLLRYMFNKLGREESMGCKSCGGRKEVVRNVVEANGTFSSALDGQLVLVEYVQDLAGRINKGQHPVTGTTAFAERINDARMIKRGGWWYMDYGNVGCGSRLSIHVLDFQGTPERWRKIDIPKIVEAPKVEVATPDPVETKIEAVVKVEVEDLTVIDGVTEKLQGEFYENGIVAIAQVAELDMVGLMMYNGVGAKRAEKILQSAKRMK